MRQHKNLNLFYSFNLETGRTLRLTPKRTGVTCEPAVVV
jgi:hypothetical protein